MCQQKLLLYSISQATINLIRRAEKAKFKALVVTVDTSVLGMAKNITLNLIVIDCMILFIYSCLLFAIINCKLLVF